MKAALQVSVRALVEHSLRAGDLNLESFGISSTADAIRAHQKVQASRGDAYRKEVAVSGSFERGPFRLEVSGRIDGVLQRESGPLVEEIKTTREDPKERASRESPTHWGQLKVYALLYARELDVSLVDTRLTYYRLETGETFEVERQFRLRELEAFVEDLVSRYLRFHERVCGWVSTRDQSISRTAFPFPSYRTGQREMAVAVYRTIQRGTELLVRAPTGSGKTQGALFPAIKALGEGETDRVFYLTARTTGRALAEQALSEMRRAGARLRAVTLTAKEKICFNPEKSCTGEDCQFARGFYDRLEAAVVESLEAEALTRDGIEALARRHRLCPFELSLEVAPVADVVIGDYNHAFDPRTHLRRFFDEGAPASTLLVDEAHNLPDRARDMYSASISRNSFLMAKRLLHANPGLGRAMGRVTAAIGRAWRDTADGKDAFSESSVPQDVLSALRGFLRRAAPSLAKPEAIEGRRELFELAFAAVWFTRIAERWDETYQTLYENRATDRVVTLFCRDPAPRLKETFASVKAAALFSATLSPEGYFRRSLGLHPESSSLALAPAFPEENLRVLVDHGIATTYRRRGATEKELAIRLTSFVSSRRGNYLIYFPSYAYLHAVHRHFPESCGVEVLVQQPGMPEDARRAFLDRFSESKGTLVGLAVMGGFFGEGIDLPGEKLEGAAIVGVGLPALSPQRDSIRERFDRSDGAGFEYAYVYPGMNRVLQAAGRVIRSETDRGVVLLIDERFRERRYRALLPREWSPRFIRTSDELRSELDSFWSRR